MYALALKGKTSPKLLTFHSIDLITKVDAILEDIWEISKNLLGCGFIWIPRESNRVADEAARMVAAGALDPSWSVNPPSSLRALIRSKMPQRRSL
ncbi:hypothetical protein PIB30_012249 [Stylosanthes scabra]|uniref:RNase H type-1 domain-containing protein n=1 Tax=Stylosanthes scabra TaxID=79078 RepID=A0ABU6W5H0_9FABA|nr:hypothetical protein [Stylosanthes scabra]